MSDVNKGGDLKPRVAFVGFGDSGKRLIARLQGVQGFSVFLYLDIPAAPDDGTMEWRFFETDPNSPDSSTLVNLEDELSRSDIVFVIDSYHWGRGSSKNERSASVMELARVCGAIPIKFHIFFPAMAFSAYARMVEMIKDRFAVADENLMQFARDTYAEYGLLSKFEKSLVKEAVTLPLENTERESND